jgi:very-short-patch-repair endonuclease
MKNIERFNKNLVKYNLSVDRVPKSVHDKVIYTCNVCKHIMDSVARKLSKENSSGCAMCAGSALKNNDIIDSQLMERNLFRVEDYRGARIPITFECKKCSNQWKATTDNIINKKKGCPVCAQDIRNEKQTYNKQDVIDLLKDCHFEFVNETEEINYYDKQHVKCLKCKYDDWHHPNRIVQNNSCCYFCYTGKLRKNERLIRNFLKDNDINYKFDYHVKNIGSDENYRIDFFIYDKNIAIEYNGAQHYEEKTFGSKTRNPKIELEKQMKRDQYVRDLCKSNFIELIEIDGRHYKFNKLENILKIYYQD